jgi:flagellin
MISIQTNYAAMVGANNLNVNNTFQTKTIQALTSGYRINSSGDDPAGLAVANQYASNVAQLTQGVINANSGVSTLQIIDGGMSNISTMLQRMQTLATESASGTFTGDRGTVQAEFATLQTEINREASNIGLSTTNSANATTLNVYIGGGNNAANSQVSIDLGSSYVDATSLGVGAGVSVSGSTYGVTMDTGGGTNLNNSTLYLAGDNTQVFTFTNLDAGGDGATITVDGGTNGITSAQALDSLNAQLSPYGVTASLNADGILQFQGSSNTMTVASADPSGGTAIAATGTGTGAAVPGATDTANALAAVTAINGAIAKLGSAQGAVGAGENDLNYAIGLATSQSTNYSSAESQIRDADVATEAANLTKAQVMQQAAVAAMAQANAAPQALLKLLQ